MKYIRHSGDMVWIINQAPSIKKEEQIIMAMLLEDLPTPEELALEEEAWKRELSKLQTPGDHAGATLRNQRFTKVLISETVISVHSYRIFLTKEDGDKWLEEHPFHSIFFPTIRKVMPQMISVDIVAADPVQISLTDHFVDWSYKK